MLACFVCATHGLWAQNFVSWIRIKTIHILIMIIFILFRLLVSFYVYELLSPFKVTQEIKQPHTVLSDRIGSSQGCMGVPVASHHTLKTMEHHSRLIE